MKGPGHDSAGCKLLGMVASHLEVSSSAGRAPAILWRVLAADELHLALAAGQLFLVILVLGVGLFFLQRSRAIPPAGPKEKWGIRFRDQHHAARAFALGVQSLAAYFLLSLILSIVWFILDAISTQEEYEDLSNCRTIIVTCMYEGTLCMYRLPRKDSAIVAGAIPRPCVAGQLWS